jgi:hypothetical protein
MSDLFECASCHKRREKTGSGLRLILGLKSRVCPACRATIDSRRGITQKPPKQEAA